MIQYDFGEGHDSHVKAYHWRWKHPGFHWMDVVDNPDDGFGNVMIPVGSWYHEHPTENLPSERHILANNHGARCFFFEHWHELLKAPWTT